ncbi:MAG: acyl-CoA dehydrogenase family protein [Pirellulales bacterium]|nr:acyl-CoA dehydrogenase family protein [Pirellulales bacterium]
MNFCLTDEQKELQTRARAFARQKIPPHIAEMDRTNGYPWPLIKELAQEGFMGITIPKEFGGAGRPLIDAILVVEEIAKVCGTIARVVVDSNTAVPKAIAEYGNAAQRQKFLPTIVGGDKPVIAITEPEAGSAATWLKTSATIDGDHVVLNGKKCWITGAGSSRLYLVFARFDNVAGAGGIGAVLVTADTKGLKVARIPMMMGLRGMPEGEVDFVNCRVPKSQILVMPGDGFRKLMRCYNLQRVGAATVALGIGQGAFDLAAAYANKRKQFGQSIGSFQGVRWMFADMHMRLESARLLVYRAATTNADGFPDKMAAATAKVCASEAAIAVTNAALQVHGAAGYSCDLPLERMVRDARMFTIGGGTAEMQRNLIGSEVLARASTELQDVA